MQVLYLLPVITSSNGGLASTHQEGVCRSCVDISLATWVNACLLNGQLAFQHASFGLGFAASTSAAYAHMLSSLLICNSPQDLLRLGRGQQSLQYIRLL